MRFEFNCISIRGQSLLKYFEMNVNTNSKILLVFVSVF